jgi:carbon-monoxide dehydrogenase medium subunit
MKPARFRYWAPDTVGEVVDFLASHGDDVKLLAGGQSLMPVMNMRLARPEYLIDLNSVGGLAGIGQGDDDIVVVGAMTTHEAILDSDLVKHACPLLHVAAPWIGHSAIRHRGTVGGSLVHADPAAELPAVAVALEAEIVLRRDRGSRTVPAEEFFVSYFTTSTEPDELVTEVRFPAQPAGARVAVKEIARRRGDFALAGVAVSVTVEPDAVVSSARICAFGVGEVPRRMREAEAALTGSRPSDGLLHEAGELAAKAVEPESDMHASATYRRDMTSVLTRRALQMALADDGRALVNS